jgi:hypothetical protein
MNKMGLMKYFKNYLLFCFLCLCSCTAQKILQTETPFELGKATCQHYVGGLEESESGVELRIPLSIIDNATIEVQQIYFRGKQVKAALGTTGNKKEIIVRMQSNLPESLETKGFALESDEAVLKYTGNGETKFTKVKSIKQKPPLLYKSSAKI